MWYAWLLIYVCQFIDNLCQQKRSNSFSKCATEILLPFNEMNFECWSLCGCFRFIRLSLKNFQTKSIDISICWLFEWKWRKHLAELVCVYHLCDIVLNFYKFNSVRPNIVVQLFSQTAIIIKVIYDKRMFSLIIYCGPEKKIAFHLPNLIHRKHSCIEFDLW